MAKTEEETAAAKLLIQTAVARTPDVDNVKQYAERVGLKTADEVRMVGKWANGAGPKFAMTFRLLDSLGLLVDDPLVSDLRLLLGPLGDAPSARPRSGDVEILLARLRQREPQPREGTR